MKAGLRETRAWLSLWNRWQPDLFIDCHVTDGADYQYNITYQFEHHEGVAPSVLSWSGDESAKFFPPWKPRATSVSWYLEFANNRDFSKGAFVTSTVVRVAAQLLYPLAKHGPAS